jgi:hypothetical protein
MRTTIKPLYWPFFVASILGLSASNLQAQMNFSHYDEKAVHFGFLVGLNSSGFAMSLDDAVLERDDSLRYVRSGHGPGFQLGVVSDFRMAEHAALRFTPTLMFLQRDMYYSYTRPNSDLRKSVQMANLDFPLLFKWRSDRIRNYRMYVVGGFKYSIDMASQERVVDDVERVKLRRHDYSFDVGVGMDLYFPFFKMSPELRFSQGIRNTLVPEKHIYSAPLDALLGRTIILSIHFE